MKFNLIKKETEKEIRERYNWDLSTEESLNKALKHFDKKYKGDYEKQKEKLSKFLKGRFEKAYKIKEEHLKKVEEAEDFKSLIITIEWNKSYMWGSNPRAYTDKGFVGGSIGGCGYCKRSTATAEAFNSDLSFLKLLYTKKEKELKNPKEFYTEQNGFKGNTQSHINAEILGYGSGYSAIPHICGGVGIESHKKICSNLGLKFSQVTNTDKTDVYLIEIKTEEEKETEEPTLFNSIKSICAVGSLLSNNKKEKNDFQTRILKAGLENRGLIIPSDWDSLTEEEKENRLNKVIEVL